MPQSPWRLVYVDPSDDPRIGLDDFVAAAQAYHADRKHLHAVILDDLITVDDEVEDHIVRFHFFDARPA